MAIERLSKLQIKILVTMEKLYYYEKKGKGGVEAREVSKIVARDYFNIKQGNELVPTKVSVSISRSYRNLIEKGMIRSKYDMIGAIFYIQFTKKGFRMAKNYFS